jgi:acyl-CoA thioesterase-2
LHRNVLAYVSDYQLVSTATMPHGIHFAEGNVQLASLDHAMWFHRPFRADEWLLYAMESPNASGGRGLARGQFFTRDGKLVASTAQEGLIRIWS